jgi:hypothetical protein
LVDSGDLAVDRRTLSQLNSPGLAGRKRLVQLASAPYQTA